MTTAREIAGVPETLFVRIWEFVKACDEREKHFNSLQGQYRALASTWLLAAFAGVGLAFSEDLQWGAPRELIAIGIAVAGAIGLALVWVLDVLVYHELLVSSYVAGRKLEKAFPWLPQTRSHFSQLKRGMAVRSYIAFFYGTGVGVLCFVGLLIGAVATPIKGSWWWLAPGVPGLIGLGVIVLMRVATQRAISWKQTLDAAPWITVEEEAGAAERNAAADEARP